MISRSKKKNKPDSSRKKRMISGYYNKEFHLPQKPMKDILDGSLDLSLIKVNQSAVLNKHSVINKILNKYRLMMIY